ncbi:hypothetical protein PHMEG_00019565 [Phytophthora megakarya]|uniref:Uncharacterized protein n=1 Tax=Phytophthora megakarya TaxID=4795 RepID=A0A225VT56_9STRA|nr:hypothetical protein PHMEG_00019565 [Phytophthora megakarya]
MAPGTDLEVEGVTAFAQPVQASYRYLISLKSEKVNIWLEDRNSKKQWQSGFLSKDDYVTAANTFVDASAADYVSCFQQCLNSSLDDADESQRKLHALQGEKLQLEMSIKLRLLRSVRNVNYTFKLNPVAVEKIDILESKLKDQQEELERLHDQIGKNPIFLYAESATWDSSKLKWNTFTSEDFLLTEDRTSITVLVPGLYAIAVLVNHVPTTDSAWISLQKNGSQVQSATAGGSYNSYNEGYGYHQTSSSLMCILKVEKNEQFAVICTGTDAIADSTSYLTALRIGA